MGRRLGGAESNADSGLTGLVLAAAAGLPLSWVFLLRWRKCFRSAGSLDTSVDDYGLRGPPLMGASLLPAPPPRHYRYWPGRHRHTKPPRVRPPETALGWQ